MRVDTFQVDDLTEMENTSSFLSLLQHRAGATLYFIALTINAFADYIMIVY